MCFPFNVVLFVPVHVTQTGVLPGASTLNCVLPQTDCVRVPFRVVFTVTLNIPLTAVFSEV